MTDEQKAELANLLRDISVLADGGIQHAETASPELIKAEWRAAKYAADYALGLVAQDPPRS